MMKSKARVVAASLLLVAGMSSFAAEPEGWKLELTPYVWMAGINADVTVKGKELKVDQSFSDLIDKVDAAASLIAVAEHGRWQAYGEGDYMSLSADGDKGDVSGKVRSNLSILTGGGGYKFDGPFEGSEIAVLGGLRYTHMQNKIRIDGVGSASRSGDLLDALFILRPSVPLTEKLRFNPTMNIGAGDSDLTYELQPELQYNFTKTLAGRVGYRRVYYKVRNSGDNEFDGSLAGFVVGLGVTF